MVKKQWAIIEEVEKLTEENASDFLAPSVYGQVKIKGKFIRDEQGKLVPVLVKTRRQVQIQQPATLRMKRKRSGNPKKIARALSTGSNSGYTRFYVSYQNSWLNSWMCF